MVVALLPPPPPDKGTTATTTANQQTQALFYRPGDLRGELATPLRSTISARTPRPETLPLSGPEAQRIDALTRSNLFLASFQQGQDAHAFLVLAGRRSARPAAGARAPAAARAAVAARRRRTSRFGRGRRGEPDGRYERRRSPPRRPARLRAGGDSAGPDPRDAG